MTRYRRLPVEVEAFQLTDANIGDVESWPEWARQARALDWWRVGAIWPSSFAGFLYLRTVREMCVANVGDWIVREAGEICLVEPEAFAAGYAPLEQQAPCDPAAPLRLDDTGEKGSIWV